MSINVGALEALLTLRDQMSPALLAAVESLAKAESQTEAWTEAQQRAQMAMAGLHDEAIRLNAALDKDRGLAARLDVAGQKLQDVGGKMQGAGMAFLPLTAVIGGIGAAAIVTAGQFEQTKIAFTTMLGSSERATAFLKEMEAFAAKTPFEFKDVTNAAKRLMALGFSAEQVLPMLRTVGDAVAGLGGGAQMIDRVTLALGQMQAKGKVSAQEMNQLAESGIPAWELLAKSIGVSIPEAMKQAEGGTILAAQAIPAILEGMNAKFAGLMDKQSKTVLGQWSNVKDQMFFIARDLGNALLPMAMSLVESVQKVLPVLKSLVDAFAGLPPGVQLAVVGFAAFLAALGPVLLALGTMATGVGSILTLLGTAGGLAAVTTIATGALTLLAGAVVGVMIYKLASWLLDAIPGLRSVTDWLTQMAMKLFGVQQILDIYNKHLEKGKVATAGWTAEEKAAYAAFVASAGARKKAAEEAAKAAAAMTGAVKPVVALTNEQIGAMLREKEAAEKLKKATEALGKPVTDLATATRVLMMAEADSTAGRKRAVAELEKQQQLIAKATQAAQAGAYKQAQEIVKATDKTMLYRLDKEADYWKKTAELAKQHEERRAALDAQTEDEIERYRSERFAQWVRDQNAALAAAKWKETLKQAISDLPNVILGAIQGGGNVGQAIGAHLGGSLGKSLSEKFGGVLKDTLGKTLGGALGSLLPGLGSLLGSVAGQLLDKFNIGGNRVIMQVNDMRDAFFKAQGGFVALQQKLQGLTNQDLVKKIFDAKTVEEFEAAVANVNRLLDNQAQAQQALQEAIDRYGFTIEELGPKFAQQKLDEMAAQLIQDYRLLAAAGVDVNAIIARMGPAFVDYVNQVIAAGGTIPEAMRPIIERLLQEGKLVDENGKAYTSLEEANIHFAKTQTEMFDALIKKLDEWISALLGIPTDIETTVTTNYTDRGDRTGGSSSTPPSGWGPRPPGYPPHLPWPPVQAATGFEGWVSRPTSFVVGEAGPEYVSVRPRGEAGTSGAAPAAAAASVTETVHVHVDLDGREIGDAVVRRQRAGLMGR